MTLFIWGTYWKGALLGIGVLIKKKALNGECIRKLGGAYWKEGATCKSKHYGN